MLYEKWPLLLTNNKISTFYFTVNCSKRNCTSNNKTCTSSLSMLSLHPSLLKKKLLHHVKTVQNVNIRAWCLYPNRMHGRPPRDLPHVSSCYKVVPIILLRHTDSCLKIKRKCVASWNQDNAFTETWLSENWSDMTNEQKRCIRRKNVKISTLGYSHQTRLYS